MLERYLERAEPRARFLHDEITTRASACSRGLAARREPGDGAASA